MGLLNCVVCMNGIYYPVPVRVAQSSKEFGLLGRDVLDQIKFEVHAILDEEICSRLDQLGACSGCLSILATFVLTLLSIRYELMLSVNTTQIFGKTTQSIVVLILGTVTTIGEPDMIYSSICHGGS